MKRKSIRLILILLCLALPLLLCGVVLSYDVNRRLALIQADGLSCSPAKTIRGPLAGGYFEQQFPFKPLHELAVPFQSDTMIGA